ncbi:MAG TPA: DUF2232 domain-containing protein [Ktedonobacteraceae bacterium]|nr:DUF2232 domain-containing protein [Ktedonobacteraceae bacterium]
MFRKLTAIEIAEGALLADIGIVFQLLALYLPIGKSIFQLLTPIVFTIIVLRRDFYVGLMSLVVAVLTVGIISGPGNVTLMLLEAGAGLFLGLVMKHRRSDLFVIFVGTTSGTFAFYALILLSDLALGIPISDLVKGLQHTFSRGTALLGLVASSVGLGPFWQHSLLPPLNAIATWAFTYWWLSYYLFTWVLMLPVVIVVFYLTNLFARMLGYDVKPFPSGWLDALQYWFLRTCVSLIPRNGIGKHWLAQVLRREVRRIGIARQRTKS